MSTTSRTYAAGVHEAARVANEAEVARLRAEGHVFYACDADVEREPTAAEVREVVAAWDAEMRRRFPGPRVGEVSAAQRLRNAARALEAQWEADGVAFERYEG